MKIICTEFTEGVGEHTAVPHTKMVNYVFESSEDLQIIGNQIRFSSCLLIPMFIRTPCRVMLHCLLLTYYNIRPMVLFRVICED